MTSAAMTEVDGSAWDDLRWQRHLERLDDPDDQPVLVLGPGGEKDGMWSVFTTKP